MYLHNFSQNLTHLCREHGFTPLDLACVLDIKDYKASALLLGWLAPDSEDLAALSKLFGLSIDQLLSKPINEQQNDWNLLAFSPFSRN